MKKLPQRVRTILLIMTVIFLVSLTFFILSRVYRGTLPKVVEEFNNSIIGAILTAIITTFLLVQQTQSDEVREKKSKVFEEKLKIYERFLETIKNVTQDNKITVDSNSDELKELIFELSMVKMHSSGMSTQKVINRLQDMNDLLNSKEIETNFDYQRFSEIIFEIVDVFQFELYEGSLGDVEVDLKELMKKLVVCVDSDERFFSEPEEFISFFR